MFKKLLGLFAPAARDRSSVAKANLVDNLPDLDEAFYETMFCDNLSAFRPNDGSKPADWQAILFSESPNPDQISALALDDQSASRLRALAFNWLRQHARQTPKGIVLAVIFDVPLKDGLTIVGAYSDGSVRYLDQSGKFAIVEQGALPAANQRALRIIELAKPLTSGTEPWLRPRLPPPSRPNVRITLIASDGLYVREAPFKAMGQDDLTGSLLSEGAALMGDIVEHAST